MQPPTPAVPSASEPPPSPPAPPSVDQLLFHLDDLATMPLLNACGGDAGCYLARIGDPAARQIIARLRARAS